MQAGDIDVFALLAQRYEQKLLRYARKFLLNSVDAEDVVQEVFLKAYKNIKDFDTSRKFSSWIYRIAHNEFINAGKKKSRELLDFFDPDIFFPHLLSKETADKDIRESELKDLVTQYLEQLDMKYREPIMLYYFEDMNYKEIAEVLRIPVATVGVRITRGKDKLKLIHDNLNI